MRPEGPNSHRGGLFDMVHSPAYFAAAGVRDRRFGWEHAGQDKIADPLIHVLIDKVRFGPAPPDADRFRQGAVVGIETIDGRRVSASIPIPAGAACRGLDWADVEDKFRALVPRTLHDPHAVEQSYTAIKELHTLTTVDTLLASLRSARV